MKHAVIDGDGFPTAFFDTIIHGDAIAADALEITDSQWRDLIENPGLRRLVNGNVVPYEPPEPAVDLVAYAANRRWQKEVGGITVAGVPVQTDRSSQAMISGAVALCDKVPDTIIKFKASDGFVDLDAATMTAIAIAVGQHVQAVFAIEATVRAAIEAGTITTTAQIDAAFEP